MTIGVPIITHMSTQSPPNTQSPVFSISISISVLSFSIAQTPTVRPRAHYIVIISFVIRLCVMSCVIHCLLWLERYFFGFVRRKLNTV